jgi:hypothetical protein
MGEVGAVAPGELRATRVLGDYLAVYTDLSLIITGSCA